MTNEEKIERAKREMFGEKVEFARDEVIGSGISETTRIALDAFHAFHPFDDGERVIEMTTPWVENRAMIVRLFGPVFARRAKCPGRDRPQCCRAEQRQACYPNWQAREDPEWYAQQINVYLSQVEDRLRDVTPVTALLAADEAFELGCLVTEARIKFRWDESAKRGAKSDAGSRLGGSKRRDANKLRKSPEETISAVDALLDQGRQKKAAYGEVAAQQGVSIETIRKEYKAVKKQR